MGPSFQIVLRSGPTPGKTFPLVKSEIFIGRDLSNDVVINDPSVILQASEIEETYKISFWDAWYSAMPD